MVQFDSELRANNDWVGWERDRRHLYAIRHDGSLYPVKKIVSLASGAPVSNFHGGRYAGHANETVRKLGFEVVPLRVSNPDWSRDELILALDLYLRHRPKTPSAESEAVRELSLTLRRLGHVLFGEFLMDESFRNANGVYMKLMNFRRFDPHFMSAGKKGLPRGAKEEEFVWNEFADDPER